MESGRDRYLKTASTEFDVIVSSPLGHSVIVTRVSIDCPIRIQEYEFSGDLMELPFHDFDLILGMDWLSRHRVIIDCSLKRVTFRTSNGAEVLMVGDRKLWRNFQKIFLDHNLNILFGSLLKVPVLKFGFRIR
ncbi:hypothetical protein ACOSP7_020242 [Xanthoceras sorbifolium]